MHENEHWNGISFKKFRFLIMGKYAFVRERHFFNAKCIHSLFSTVQSLTIALVIIFIVSFFSNLLITCEQDSIQRKDNHFMMKCSSMIYFNFDKRERAKHLILLTTRIRFFFLNQLTHLFEAPTFYIGHIR